MTLIDTDIITASEVEFLHNASILIDQQSARTLQNYMIWRFIMNQVKNMPKQFRTIKQTLDQIYAGVSTESSRSITCAKYINENMGLAVAKLFIRDNFDKNARSQVI